MDGLSLWNELILYRTSMIMHIPIYSIVIPHIFRKFGLICKCTHNCIAYQSYRNGRVIWIDYCRWKTSRVVVVYLEQYAIARYLCSMEFRYYQRDIQYNQTMFMWHCEKDPGKKSTHTQSGTQTRERLGNSELNYKRPCTHTNGLYTWFMVYSVYAR